jgi:hypothetical protein
MIEFQCPGCNRRLRVKDEAAGRKARCPGCRQIVQIPAAGAEEELVLLDEGPAAPGAPGPAPAAPPPAAPPPLNIDETPVGQPLPPTAARVAVGRPAPAMRPAGRMSKAFFVGAIVGGLAIGSIVIGIAAVSIGTGMAELMNRGEEPTPEEVQAVFARAGPLLPIGGLIQSAGAVVLLIFVYKIWAAVRAPGVSPSPGLAVGLFFVPLVNIFWMFYVYGRWPKVINEAARQRGIEGVNMPAWLGWALCILAFVPCVSLANLVLLPLYVARGCDAVNALAAE